MPFGRRTRCLHCMKGYVVNGRCQFCGKYNRDPEREQGVLPFGYQLRQRYVIGRVLGRGGFGVTYLAWDNAQQRRVAVKELFPTKATRASDGLTVVMAKSLEDYYAKLRERFVGEARMIGELRSESAILNIYDYFEANQTGYYVMEFLEGRDLRSLFKAQNGVMSWQSLERPVKDILDGLEVLHKRALIHRDISPDNIFVCSDGKTKLIDFGSMRRGDAMHYTVILKADFAPPEQFLAHGNQGPWTDTYSLCATLYYLLSGGKRLKSAESRFASLSLDGEDPLPPLSSFSPNAPDYVVEAIMHGLKLRETERFQNVEEMRKALFPAAETRNSALRCVRGRFSGRSFPLRMETFVPLGRGAGNRSGIEYPENPQQAPGISTRHCVFYLDRNGRLFVQDLHSRFGTFVNGQKLQPGNWERLLPGQYVQVGGELFAFGEPN